MKKYLRPLFSIFLFLGIFTGVLYPLLVTGVAQLLFPIRANGSLIRKNDSVVGSGLIGQFFTDESYFWGRPSATSPDPYTAFNPSTLTGSTGSNLGPLSKTLINEVQNQVFILHNADPTNTSLIPVDLVTTSASGLDPNISVAAAYYQAARIAKARNMSIPEITSLIDKLAEQPQFGFLGETRVNVLKLNLALDGLEYK
jgi:potassium-transporting ATPase KdpC subunit